MITSVMFDMGGTLEDVFVDEQSELAAVEELDRMLREGGLDPEVDLAELKRRVDAFPGRSWSPSASPSPTCGS